MNDLTMQPLGDTIPLLITYIDDKSYYKSWNRDNSKWSIYTDTENNTVLIAE